MATLLFGTDQIPFLPDGGAQGVAEHADPRAAQLVLAGGRCGRPRRAWSTRFTKLGRYTYAVGNNEEIARSNGIPVGRQKIIIFVVAGGCSALAGVLASMQLGAGSATVGIGILFLTIAAVVIGGTSLGGGKGGMMRTTLGVLLLTVLNNGLILSGVSSNIQVGVSGAVLIVAIIVAAWPLRSRLRIVK